MPQTVQMVAVHYANRSGRGKAAMFLPYDTVKEMVEAKLAEWDKRCKYVNLTKTEAEMYKPAPSLKPNVRTMDDFVAGKPYAVAIINKWAFAA